MKIIKIRPLAAVSTAALFFSLLSTAFGEGANPVEVSKEGDRYLFLRDGNPYEVNGGGL